MVVAYDPNVANEVYLLYRPNSREYWVCKLTDLSREYRNSSFWQVWRKQDIQKKELSKQKLAADKTRAAHEERIENIISSAVKETPKPSKTNTERMAGVSKARANQLETERAQRRASTTSAPSAKIISLHESSDDDEYPDYEDELFDGGDD